MSEDLGLWYDPVMQDWGIVNADSARLQEFAEYAAQSARTQQTWAAEYGLGELLLESANDALLQRLSCEPQTRIVIDLLVTQARRPALKQLLVYWTSLAYHEEGADRWPISKQLQKALRQSGNASES